ncbi:hypothetical protein JG687_00014306 [Phytophthora cactorum]|uniref:Uncharacterized protein n=1 Tax=Phytophthora cactorum TaxID=29920 RepID=A0A8T1TWW8_9STRA|nr:hypothetical protein JG687_00014306 [Phytophthora cactorum]
MKRAGCHKTMGDSSGILLQRQALLLPDPGGQEQLPEETATLPPAILRPASGPKKNAAQNQSRLTKASATASHGTPVKALPTAKVRRELRDAKQYSRLPRPLEEQALDRARSVRRRYYGGDIHGVVEFPPCSKVKDSAIPFFRFHLVTAHPDPKGPPNQILE